MDRAAWEAIRPNLSTVAEAADWWHVVEGPVETGIADEDRDFLAGAAAAAEAIDWAGDPWHALTDALKASTGRKGKALFLPLRLALTGRAHGPDMAALLPLIGKARAVERPRKGGRAGPDKPPWPFFPDKLARQCLARPESVPRRARALAAHLRRAGGADAAPDHPRLLDRRRSRPASAHDHLCAEL